MMKRLFIIVHEEEVKDEYDTGLASSIKAYREIQAIKKEKDFRSVDGDPTKLLLDLPSPSECEIYICGSSIAVCIPQHIEALKKAGYHVKLYRPASIF